MQDNQKPTDEKKENIQSTIGKNEFINSIKNWTKKKSKIISKRKKEKYTKSLNKIKNYFNNKKNNLYEKINNFSKKEYNLNYFKTSILGIGLLGAVAFSNFYNNYLNSNYNLNNTKNHIESLQEYKNQAKNFKITTKNNSIYLTITKQKEKLEKQLSQLKKPKTNYIVKKNDSLEKIARSIEGDNWKDGLKTLSNKLKKDYPYSQDGKKWFNLDGSHSLKPDSKNPHYLPLNINGKDNIININNMPTIQEDMNKYNNAFNKLNQEKKTLEEKLKTINPKETIKNDNLSEKIQEDILKYEQKAHEQQKEKRKNGLYSILSLIPTIFAGGYLFKNRNKNNKKEEKENKNPKKNHIPPLKDNKNDEKIKEQKKTQPYDNQKKMNDNKSKYPKIPIYDDFLNTKFEDKKTKTQNNIEEKRKKEKETKDKIEKVNKLKKPNEHNYQNKNYTNVYNNLNKKEFTLNVLIKKINKLYGSKFVEPFKESYVVFSPPNEQKQNNDLNQSNTDYKIKNKTNNNNNKQKINYEKIKKEYSIFQRRKNNYETYKNIINFRQQNKYARFDTYNTIKYQAKKQNISPTTFKRDIKWYENFLKNYIKT